MMDETLVKRKKRKSMNASSWQQVHTIVLSQLRKATGHDGISHFHGYSWTTMHDRDGRERDKKVYDPPNRAVTAAKASGRLSRLVVRF